jgi:hypothetical protein
MGSTLRDSPEFKAWAMTGPMTQAIPAKTMTLFLMLTPLKTLLKKSSVNA